MYNHVNQSDERHGLSTFTYLRALEGHTYKGNKSTFSPAESPFPQKTYFV